MKKQEEQSLSTALLQELKERGSLFLKADLEKDQIMESSCHPLQGQPYSALGTSLLPLILSAQDRNAAGQLSLAALRQACMAKEGTVQACWQMRSRWIRAYASLIPAERSHPQAYLFLQDATTEVRQIYQLERDSLTGLLLRGPAEERINALLSASEQGCAMIMIDLDDLKQMNDSCGHCCGDRALQSVADAMRLTFRRQDVMARIGGDEFAVFLEGCNDLSRLSTRISAFLENVYQAAQERCLQRPVHCSAGVVISAGSESFPELYEKADAALYQTKKREKGTWSFYAPGQNPHCGMLESA